MKIIISKEGYYLPSLQGIAEDTTGGSVTINGVKYDNISQADVNEIPDNAKDCEYVLENGVLIPNPNYSDISIDTRLNDIEQILIELLDTM